MANRYAVATGNWSDTATWDGGTLPTAGDVVRPNGFTVTIDQDITVDELTNNAAAPAVALGSFAFGAGRTITTDIIARANPTTGLVTATYGSGTSTINGDVLHLFQGVGSQVLSVTGLADGILIVNGDIYHGETIGNVNARAVLLAGDGAGFRLICNGLVSGTRTTAAAQANMHGIVCTTNYVVELNGTTEGKLNTNGLTASGVNVTGSNNVIINSGIMVGGQPNTNLGQSPAVSMPFNTLNELRHYGISIATPSQPAVNGGLVVLYDGCSIEDNFTCLAHRPLAQRFDTAFMDAEYIVPIDALTTKSFLTAGLLTGYPPESKVELLTVFGPSSEFEGTLVPVTISAGQLTDIANAVGQYITPQVLSAVTGLP